MKSNADNKLFDPLLKLYHGRPLMLNENMDVENAKANGTMCTFESIVLKEGICFDDLEKILIDGYYVWCAEASQVLHIKVKVCDADDEIPYI